MSGKLDSKPDVAVVGMGYVGLTLAVTLADLGFKVWGCEREPRVVEQLNQGQPQIFEPDVEEVLRAHIGRNLTVQASLPEGFSGVVIICVSTPVGPDHNPDLGNLRAAAESVADCIGEGALVMVRSTVPVGTCRSMVLTALQAKNGRAHLASCPERTIQGRALRELRQLPQVVGGLDEISTQKAVAFWEGVTSSVVAVSSLEAAEMVKLINNSHTDLIYSYGNEVAMMAQHLNLDPMEVIGAANLDYPRPDLARPGFVAGPCMTKDPYLLVSSLNGTGYVPRLVLGARKTNEELPEAVAKSFVQRLENHTGGVAGAKVLVCGFAYKGWPVTDDVRGTPTFPIVKELSRYPLQLYGHDYLVPQETISASGVEYVGDLRQGFEGARGVLFVNEHPDYRRLEISELAATMEPPALLYDCWRIFDSRTLESVPGVRYGGIGYG